MKSAYLIFIFLFLALHSTRGEPEARCTDQQAYCQPWCNYIVILLLKDRDNPGEPLIDWNGNGLFNISDAVLLMTDIRKGICPDAPATLASAGAMLYGSEIEGLTREDILYLEDKLAQMDLDEETRAEFSLAIYGAAEAPGLPKAFSLAQNMPNPFNPSTTITYSVPLSNAEHVTLKVYDIRGKSVRTLVDRVVGPGMHSVFWHGDNDSGRQVGSGVYFYRLKAGKFSQTRKMVLLK
jgi:FlgD Ig-like domain